MMSANTTPLAHKPTISLDDMMASGYKLVTAVQRKIEDAAPTLGMDLKHELEDWLNDVMGAITYPEVHLHATNLFMLVHEQMVTPKTAMVRLECVIGVISTWHAAIENQRRVTDAKIRATEQPPITASLFGFDRV